MKICKYCDELANASMGMCQKHYEWDLKERRQHKCKINGCNCYVFSDGLCKKHYSEAHPRPPRKCEFPGCTKYADLRMRYCWKHYAQLRRARLKAEAEASNSVKQEN